RVKQGRFREDLFHRLNVIRVHLPPLRDRREDVPILANHFLKRSAVELNVEPKQLDPETERHIVQLPWPGNVRQLENACRWPTGMAPGQVIRVEDLPPELRGGAAGREDGRWETSLKQYVEHRLMRGEGKIYRDVNESFERILIQAALKYTGGRKQEAAKKLG